MKLEIVVFVANNQVPKEEKNEGVNVIFSDSPPDII